MLRAFGIRPDSIVLEIGCGTGFYSVELARLTGSGRRPVCIDLQAEMLSHTRRRLDVAAAAADLAQANAAALPFRDGSIDDVVLITVLGELPDRAGALGEIRRVLRAGGRLLVSEQFPDPDFVTRAALRRMLGQAGFTECRSKGVLWYTSIWLKR